MGWLTLLTISILILILLIFVFLVERDRKRVQTSNRLVHFLGVIFWILYRYPLGITVFGTLFYFSVSFFINLKRRSYLAIPHGRAFYYYFHFLQE